MMMIMFIKLIIDGVNDDDDHNVYGDDNVMIMIFIVMKSMKMIMMRTMKNSNLITSFGLGNF